MGLISPQDFASEIRALRVLGDECDCLIYFNETKPASIYGGTWQELPQGTFLEATGSGGAAGQTGGSNSVTLKEENLPKMKNYLIDFPDEEAGNRGSLIGGYLGKDTMSIYQPYVQEGMARGWNERGGEVYPYAIEKGGGQAFDNRPAYCTAHIWRKVS